MSNTAKQALLNVTNAADLESLAEAIEAAKWHEDDLGTQLDRLMTNLPTFGGEAPATGTYQVWSWDETRLLVGPEANKIVAREDWAEEHETNRTPGY